MLYVTTRSNCETYTAAKTLTVDTAPDGGLFVPFQMPKVNVAELRGMPQEAVISHVLGLFFRTVPSGDEVLECLGGTPLRASDIDRKVTVAQLWNNRRRTFEKIEYDLYCKLCREVPANGKATQWAKTAIRIAVLCALVASGGREVDIAVNAGDFLTPMAAYYCRQMGMPVGTILCVTNENSNLWDLFTHGELNCSVSVLPTELPLLDTPVPAQLERLVFSVDGLHTAKEFAACLENRKTYKCENGWELSEGFAVSVVSSRRVESVISKLYRTNQYVLDTYGALTFGGLQDHRASSGDICHTLLLSEYSPMEHRKTVSAALNVPEFKLSELL